MSSERSKIVVHLPQGINQSLIETPIYSKLSSVIQSHGGTIEFRKFLRSGDLHQVLSGSRYEESNLHIVEMGRIQRRNVINSGVGYIRPFWHLDPYGVQWESSIGSRSFNPSQIREDLASAFFNELRNKLVETRRSRRDQLSQKTVIPSNSVAVFLQGNRPMRLGATQRTPLQLLELAQKIANGRPIIVKPHPLALEEDADTIMSARRMGYRFKVTQANIHDVLAAADCSISFNSATAIEGFLHCKPAILLGRSDFHHLCLDATDPSKDADHDFERFIREDRPYAEYLYWYLAMQCFNPFGPKFEKRILDLFAEMGFDSNRLGLC
jgi:hypothetical protein